MQSAFMPCYQVLENLANSVNTEISLEGVISDEPWRSGNQPEHLILKLLQNIMQGMKFQILLRFHLRIKKYEFAKLVLLS